MTYCKSQKIIALPSLLWIGAFICTILQAYWQTVQNRNIVNAWQPVNMTIGPGTILTPFWGSTMLLNAYATPVMAYRLWRISKDSEGSTSPDSLQFLMRVLVESGAMYLLITTSHFIVWWTPSTYAIAIVAAMNRPMTGIAFNLILIRTAKKKAEDNWNEQHRPPMSAMQFNTPTGVKTTELFNESGSLSESLTV